MPGLDVITGMQMGRKIAVAVLLLALIGGGYYLLIYESKVDELKEARESQETFEALNRRAYLDYQAYEELTTKLVDARRQADQDNKKLPKTRDIERFMSDINVQAKKAGLRLTNIVPADEEDSEYYTKLPISLEFRGTYHQVLHFFALIDSEIDRPTNMENLTLDRAGTEEEPNLLKGNVRATTFMAKEPTTDEAQNAGNVQPTS